jgi:hypothetical protein
MTSHLLALPLESQALFSSPLFIFSDSISHFCPGTYPSTCGLLHSWDERCIPPHPAYWLRWGLTNFLLWLASNFSPPYFYLQKC